MAVQLSWPTFDPNTGLPRLRYSPITPSPKQASFLAWSGREALFGGAGGGGKAGALDTLVPTPSGFRLLGDIHPGDFVLGRDGTTHLVEGESAVELLPGWRLTFDDGAVVECNDDHLWLTFTSAERAAATRRTPEFRERRRSQRPSRATGSQGQAKSAAVAVRNATHRPSTLAPPAGTVRSTADIVASLRTHRGEANHAVPVCAPVVLPERSLPIDPYALGVWLGDGTSRVGAITTMDPEVTMAVVEAGFPERRREPRGRACTVFFDGLTAALRTAGVLRNKHVPHDYLWASIDQRVALLAGLIDTDGHVTPNGKVEFDNTNPELAAAVAHLARSLGMKASVREGRATLGGRDCGPRYRVKFTPNRLDLSRIPRKQERLRLSESSVAKFRRIVAAERIEARPMKCLRVSAPDHLFLWTEHFIPTHNSIALLMAALQFVDVPGYNGVIFRRTLTDLELPDGLIDVSHDWLDDTDAEWNGNKKRWTFPSGAVLQFAYMNQFNAQYRYKSTQFQFIGWDELTEFPWVEQYLYLFSRLRKGVSSREQAMAVYGQSHDGVTLADVPLRVRGATNPGGPGQSWVYDRFVDPDATNRKPFLPSFLQDNPGIDADEYRAALSELPEAERRRLEDGDWSAVDVPGALWRFADIDRVQWVEPLPASEVDLRCMAIDPSITATGDECGIVVGSFKGDKLVVEADLSGRLHPDDWSKLAVTEYHRLGCSRVAVEDNAGAELVFMALGNAADALGLERPRLVRVHASESKDGRAIPVHKAYREKRVVHTMGLRSGKLEAQLTSWIPGPRAAGGSNFSPDRLDAVVWLVRHMLFREGDNVEYHASSARQQLLAPPRPGPATTVRDRLLRAPRP
ncbi:MAG: LAGLIDADG family homing endonuclease [Microthrixaceae bacterium]